MNKDLTKRINNCFLDERNFQLTGQDIEKLKETFQKGFYQINYNAETHIQSIICSDGSLINKNKVQNFWHLPQFKELPEATFQPHKLRARLDNGEPMEKTVGWALTMAHISYIGNPLNEHYGHSQGQIVDFETETLLIECTNPMKSTHLNSTEMNKKIQYFHRIDPQHKKKWILIISYITCIDKSIRYQLQADNITVIVLNTRINKLNKKLNIDTKLSLILKDIISNTPIDLTKLNNPSDHRKYKPIYDILNYKPVYQILNYTSLSDSIGVGVHLFSINISCTCDG
jgi:hypothetical protein